MGLPKQAFPLLKRPLVQVLLRLAQVGYLNNEADATRREDVLRLVLFWLVAVTDASKASGLAYKVIEEECGSGEKLGRAIHDRLIADRAAVRLPRRNGENPHSLKAKLRGVHLPLPNIEIQLNLMAEARAILPTAPDRHRAAMNFQHEVMRPFRPGTQKTRQE
jgi:hypothetical protein